MYGVIAEVGSADSVRVALYRLFGLLQNRIFAKMISTQHLDRRSSRPIFPTFGQKSLALPTDSPHRRAGVGESATARLSGRESLSL